MNNILTPLDAAEPDHEFDKGPGIDEAPLNDLDDGEAGLDPNILDDDLLEDGSMGLG